jgi:uncharacterized protein YjbI with pentapeptide repeats
MTSRRDHDPDWREQTTKYTPQEQKIIARIIGVLVVLVIGLLLGTQLFHEEHGVISGDYNLNLYIGGLSFIATVVLVDALNALRNVRFLKDRLVHEARSQSNERAKAAIDDLRHYEWLEGENGLLKGADLQVANLAGAGLRGANLSGAKLGDANLTDANLEGATLSGAYLGKATLTDATSKGANLTNAYLGDANLTDANLEGANLTGAHLRIADLTCANLEGANLTGANLENALLEGATLVNATLTDAYLIRANLTGAYMWYANLTGADLREAKFDENTTMPNGEKWHAGMDLRRYTGPDHPGSYIPSGSNLPG